MGDTPELSVTLTVTRLSPVGVAGGGVTGGGVGVGVSVGVEAEVEEDELDDDEEEELLLEDDELVLLPDELGVLDGVCTQAQEKGKRGRCYKTEG